MLTLALDSTTPAGSLAVARDGRLLAARVGDASRPHGERLPGDVLAILAEAGVALDDVELYAVATGPGAFTGLRIGIAAIQGLAFAHGRLVVGVPALDALAQSAAAGLAQGTHLAAWMDAARHEVFAALYDVGHGPGAPGEPVALEPIDPPSVGPADEVLARWASRLGDAPLVCAGDGARRYRSAIDAARPGAIILDALPPLAAAMIPLALVAAARGEAGPPHAIRPLYVRRPDAEIARDRAAAPGAS